MRWICGKSPQLIDVWRLARQSGLQPGVRIDSGELIQEKTDEKYWTWLTNEGPIRGIVLTRRSTTGWVRRAGHAPFRFPLQLRALAGARFE